MTLQAAISCIVNRYTVIGVVRVSVVPGLGVVAVKTRLVLRLAGGRDGGRVAASAGGSVFESTVIPRPAKRITMPVEKITLFSHQKKMLIKY